MIFKTGGSVTCLVELFRNLAIDFKGEGELDLPQIHKDLMAIADELENLPDIDSMSREIENLESSFYEIGNGFSELDALEGNFQNLEEKTGDLESMIEELESEVEKIKKITSPISTSG